MAIMLGYSSLDVSNLEYPDTIYLKMFGNYCQQKHKEDSSPTSKHKQHATEKQKKVIEALPLITIRLVSIQRYAQREPWEFAGWRLRITYKFNQQREKDKRYEFWYSRTEGPLSEAGQADVNISQPVSDKDLASGHLPNRGISSLPLNTGTETVYIPRDNYPRLRKGMRIFLVVDVVNNPQRGIPPVGYWGSNILKIPSLP